jgi:hypothetical protein
MDRRHRAPRLPGQGQEVVVNKSEAETVRTIFRLYLELKSFSKLVIELDRKGYNAHGFEICRASCVLTLKICR